METLIVTALSNKKHEINSISWQQLHDIDFAFDARFQLKLENKTILFINKILRIIPKKRLVAEAEWEGKKVVVKLFFSMSQAKKHMEKDAAGVKKLQENKIPTPPLYYQGNNEDKRIYVLILEQITEAENLEHIFNHQSSIEDIMLALQAVVKEIATQHVFGILQHDLHLKNYLVTEKIIYTLDGAQIEIFPKLLAKKASMEHLALFLSQLGIGNEIAQEKLFRYYAKLRGWLLKPEDIQELFSLIKQSSEKRWQRYEKKIFRASTSFFPITSWCMQGMVDREVCGPEFFAFLKNPELVFHHPTTITLKKGRSATVIKVKLDQRVLVIKRYNMKNLWHRLRRCLRKSRAYVSWRLAHKLRLFHVATARPLAFIEYKYVGFRGTSYYITEYVSGRHVGDFFKQDDLEENQIDTMIKKSAALLRNLAKLEITHGDLKMTNVLVDDNESPILIDLDGAFEHSSISSLHKAWHKEIERFLDNFQGQPELKNKFKAAL